MRISYYLVFLMGALPPVQTMALEPVTEPHAMFYYQISLGGGETAKPRHNFGFRMDQASRQPGQMIDYHSLTQKPAAMDFRFSHQGAESIKISGIDYLKMYRVHRANGEEEIMDEGGEVTDESTGDAAEEQKKGNVATRVISDVGATVGHVLEGAPTGFIIGGGILIGLLIGI